MKLIENGLPYWAIGIITLIVGAYLIRFPSILVRLLGVAIIVFGLMFTVSMWRTERSIRINEQRLIEEAAKQVETDRNTRNVNGDA